MRKITCLLLLIHAGFTMAQTKTVVTQNGEKLSINNGLTTNNGFIQLGGALTKPSVLTTTSVFTLAIQGLQTGTATDNIVVTDPVSGVLKYIAKSDFAGDNLGNHTATLNLNMASKDIVNISNAYVKNELQLLDRVASNTNYFGIYKNSGAFNIWNNSQGINALSINENTNKTTLMSAQITTGTDGSTPEIGSVAVSADAVGNIKWVSASSLGSGDNLGNHTATTDLLMKKNDIIFEDRYYLNSNKINFSKTNGIFSIKSSVNNANALAIDEITNKTTLAVAQISKGTDGNPPTAGAIATAADASGNIIWTLPASTPNVKTPKLVGIAKVATTRTTGTNVYFDTNVVNPENAFGGNISGGSFYQIQKAGLHQIFVNLTVAVPTGDWYLRILRNGGPIAAIDAAKASGASAVVFAIDDFAVGDRISVDMGGAAIGYSAGLTKIAVFRFE